MYPGPFSCLFASYIQHLDYSHLIDNWLTNYDVYAIIKLGTGVPVPRILEE